MTIAQTLTHVDRYYRRNKAVTLLSAGMTAKDVAERLNLSRNYVREVGRDAGVPMVHGNSVRCA